MVTFANHHFLDFAISWVTSAKKCGITGYIVGATVRLLLGCFLRARLIVTWTQIARI